MRSFLLYYEDDGQPENFGLHNLVVSCIRDDLGETVPHYRTLAKSTFQAHPCHGRDRLLRKCKEDAKDLGAAYVCALGIVDGDKLHESKLGIGRGACKREMHTAFHRHCAHDRAVLVVIDDHTETIVDAACDALRIERVAKDMNARDRVLSRAADSACRAPRDAIRSQVGSLDRLVRKLACAYTATR